MPIDLQKPLSWVQRYLYHIAQGPLPPVQASLSIDYDWPLESVLQKPPDYVTIAGQVITDMYVPAPDRHGLVYLLTAGVVAGGPVPATDSFALLLRDLAGDGARPFEVNGTAWASTMIAIGGNRYDTGNVYFGADPVYVAPGQILRILHTSVAGGVTLRARAYVIDRPSYYPLRLP